MFEEGMKEEKMIPRGTRRQKSIINLETFQPNTIPSVSRSTKNAEGGIIIDSGTKFISYYL